MIEDDEGSGFERRLVKYYLHYIRSTICHIHMYLLKLFCVTAAEAPSERPQSTSVEHNLEADLIYIQSTAHWHSAIHTVVVLRLGRGECYLVAAHNQFWPSYVLVWIHYTVLQAVSTLQPSESCDNSPPDQTVPSLASLV